MAKTWWPPNFQKTGRPWTIQNPGTSHPNYIRQLNYGHSQIATGLVRYWDLFCRFWKWPTWQHEEVWLFSSQNFESLSALFFHRYSFESRLGKGQIAPAIADVNLQRFLMRKCFVAIGTVENAWTDLVTFVLLDLLFRIIWMFLFFIGTILSSTSSPPGASQCGVLPSSLSGSAPTILTSFKF